MCFYVPIHKFFKCFSDTYLLICLHVSKIPTRRRTDYLSHITVFRKDRLWLIGTAEVWGKIFSPHYTLSDDVFIKFYHFSLLFWYFLWTNVVIRVVKMEFAVSLFVMILCLRSPSNSPKHSHAGFIVFWFCSEAPPFYTKRWCWNEVYKARGNHEKIYDFTVH